MLLADLVRFVHDHKKVGEVEVLCLVKLIDAFHDLLGELIVQLVGHRLPLAEVSVGGSRLLLWWSQETLMEQNSNLQDVGISIVTLEVFKIFDSLSGRLEVVQTDVHVC